MSAWIRWSALLLAACSLSACVVYPAGYYRYERRYEAPPPPPRYYHHHGYREWGAAQPVQPGQPAQTEPALA